MTKGASVGYLLSALLLAVGLVVLRTREQPALAVEVCIQLARFSSAAAVLTCLVAWWLPHTYGVGGVVP